MPRFYVECNGTDFEVEADDYDEAKAIVMSDWVSIQEIEEDTTPCTSCKRYPCRCDELYDAYKDREMEKEFEGK